MSSNQSPTSSSAAASSTSLEVPAASRQGGNRYNVSNRDYKNVPRWHDDGLTRLAADFVSGKMKHNVYTNASREQTALTEVLGGWAMPSTMEEMGAEFMHRFPLRNQHVRAEEQADHAAATAYLHQFFENKQVVKLLRSIGCGQAVKRERNRFVGLYPVILALLKAGKASDFNVELLFGKVQHVRDMLLDIGNAMVEGDDVSQIYMNKRSDVNVPVNTTALSKMCEACSATRNESFKRCKACKSVVYCTRECQVSHWPKHHPDCLVAQGKPVPARVLAKAEAVYEKEREVSRVEIARKTDITFKELEQEQAGVHSIEVGLSADSWNGIGPPPTVVRIDLPPYEAGIIEHAAKSVGLEFVREFNITLKPAGISQDFNHGVQLINPEAGGAVILVMYSWLFNTENNEEVKVGVNISDIYVIDHIDPTRQGLLQPQWKEVTPPVEWTENHHTRLERFIYYLKVAKAAAVCEEWLGIWKKTAGTDDMVSQSVDVGDEVLEWFDYPSSGCWNELLE